MKIEKLSEDKIKVTIDPEEARVFDISTRNIASDSPNVREVFRLAVKFAEKKMRFNVDGAKLFIEAIPGQTDGFGMLITKIRSDAELRTAISSCPYNGKIIKQVLHPDKPALKTLGERIFRFAEFENICRAAESIHSMFKGASTLYKYNGFYFLLLVPESVDIMIMIEKIVLEFSDVQDKTLISHGRLNELGEVMIKENAIEILTEYFG